MLNVDSQIEAMGCSMADCCPAEPLIELSCDSEGAVDENLIGFQLDRSRSRSRTAGPRPTLANSSVPPAKKACSDFGDPDESADTPQTDASSPLSSAGGLNLKSARTAVTPLGMKPTPILPKGDCEGMTIKPEGEPGRDGALNYYSCSQCNKFFWTENSMRHHYSMYHSEKAFVCEICGKAFRFRSNLAEHRSVHTSVKPYVCKYCGKSSRLKGNLTKHILKHHKQETNAVVGKEDIIIKKGKKSVKDPKCIDFLEKSMIILTNRSSSSGASSPVSASTALAAMASASQNISRPNGSVKMAIPSALLTGLNGVGKAGDSPNRRPSATPIASDQAIKNSVDAIIESALVGGGQRGGVKDDSLPVEVPVSFLPASNGSWASVESPDSSMMSNCSDPANASSEIDATVMNVVANAHGDQSTISRDLIGHQENGEQNGSPAPAAATAIKHSETQCYFCGKHFRKASNLEDHLQAVHGAVSIGSMVAVPERRRADLSDIAKTEDASVIQSTDAYSIVNCVTPITKWPLSHKGSSNGSVSTESPVGSDAPAPPEKAAPHPSSKTLNGPSTSVSASTLSSFAEKLSSLTGCHKDIQEIKGLLSALKASCTTSNSSGSSQSKIENLLASLDSRVSRVERQMEASLSTLGTLIQVQNSMNLAMTQFRAEIMQKVATIAEQLNPGAAATERNCASSPPLPNSKH